MKQKQGPKMSLQTKAKVNIEGCVFWSFGFLLFVWLVRGQRFISDINFLGPIEYVKAYDPFIYLIDGKAETEIEQYITEVHSFDEFATKVKFFDDLGIE